MAAPHTPDWAKLIQVFSKATDRMRAGSKKYGEYKPLEDDRDMFEELKEELQDAIVYIGMIHMLVEELQALYGPWITALKELSATRSNESP